MKVSELENIRKEFKEFNKFESLCDGQCTISLKGYDWLVKQVETLEEIKLLIEDEKITKGETVDKIAKLIF